MKRCKKHKRQAGYSYLCGICGKWVPSWKPDPRR